MLEAKEKMVPTLCDIFVSVPPREEAGGRTTDRFHYQWNWALCHLLTLHEAGQDYLVAFEYHDDVIDFDSADDPKAIRFYQIKTRDDDGWTSAKLLHRKNSKSKTGPKPLSIVGKLFLNKLQFPDHTASVSFVTNASLKLPLLHGIDPRKFKAADLSSETRDKFIAQIKQEHTLNADPVIDDLILFEQAELILDDHDRQTRARLGDFLEAHYDQSFRVGAIHRALIGEIMMRGKPRPTSPKDFPEFAKSRCLSRKDFEGFLSYVGVGVQSYENRWLLAHQALQADGSLPFRIAAIRSKWRIHEADRVNGGKPFVRELTKAVKSAISALSVDPVAATLPISQLCERIVTDAAVVSASAGLLDADYLYAVALMEFYEL